MSSIGPEIAEEVRERLKSVNDGLSAVREELHRITTQAAERAAEFDEGPDDDLREKVARFTDTDLVYLAFAMRNTANAQAANGCIPAVGVLHTLTAALSEMTARFVPGAVLERVDRIFEEEAEPDFFDNRFLRNVLSEDGGDDD
jgi:hypothetical protein